MARKDVLINLFQVCQWNLAINSVKDKRKYKLKMTPEKHTIDKLRYL